MIEIHSSSFLLLGPVCVVHAGVEVQIEYIPFFLSFHIYFLHF